MPKTLLGSEEEQQLKKLFIESLNGKDTLIAFGRAKLAGGRAVVSIPKGMSDLEMFIQQVGATTTGYTYSVEYWPNNLIIHSSNSGDTAEISYMIIGN
jgi:hypothetical protein